MEMTLTTPFIAIASGTIKEVRAVMRTQTADTALGVLVNEQPKILSNRTMIGRWKTGSKVAVREVVSVLIQEGDLIEVTSVAREAPGITTAIRSPNGILPKWKVWKVQSDTPKWFGAGSTVRLTALSSPVNVITATVSGWDKATGKFEIDDCQLPTKWDYTSWSVSLVEPTLATIESCELVVEYPEPIIDPIPDVTPEPESDRPQPDPTTFPKRRRIMM